MSAPVKAALQDLLDQGLVEKVKGKYLLTAAGRQRAAELPLELGEARVGCPHCPHCIGSGRAGFPLIDPDDPALTTNQPRPPRRRKR